MLNAKSGHSGMFLSSNIIMKDERHIPSELPLKTLGSYPIKDWDTLSVNPEPLVFFQFGYISTSVCTRGSKCHLFRAIIHNDIYLRTRIWVDRVGTVTWWEACKNQAGWRNRCLSSHMPSTIFLGFPGTKWNSWPNFIITVIFPFFFSLLPLFSLSLFSPPPPPLHYSQQSVI